MISWVTQKSIGKLQSWSYISINVLGTFEFILLIHFRKGTTFFGAILTKNQPGGLLKSLLKTSVKEIFEGEF